MSSKALRGRGAGENPANRFIPLHTVPWPDHDPAEDPALATQFFRDDSRTILASNDSPDIPFRFSLNPYRGCEHGCIYCYARPTHEYLSFSSGLDFESKIMVKEDAPALLRKHFLSKKWQPQSVTMSGVTDPYQPIERRLRLTRRCLEVFTEFRNPVAVITKNALVTRDIDLLADLARRRAAAVFVSITTLDDELARQMEPRASVPAARLRAIEELTAADVPVGVMFAPAIPGLNDHEAPAVLQAAANAGALTAAFTVIRLPFAVKDLFTAWLSRHFPARKERVLGRIRAIRGGVLNNPRFGERMTAEGPWGESFSDLFRLAKKRAGLDRPFPQLSADGFRRSGLDQGSLFGDE